jgi:hypothetical protein
LKGHKKEKTNIGLKGPDNLEDFNKMVNKIKLIDPNSVKYKNLVTKFIARYGIDMLKTFVPPVRPQIVHCPFCRGVSYEWNEKLNTYYCP